MIIWIIGLSGSGKTTLGKEMMDQLNTADESWMIIDGDRFRTILGEEYGHDIESRKKIGQRLVNLSQEFDRQNQNLIVCVLSLFPEHQLDNRNNIRDYKEIFLDVSLETLRKRDNKGLYAKADRGEESNVVGVDIPFPKPENADFVIDNNKDLVSMKLVADEILKDLRLSKDFYKYTNNDLLTLKEKYEYTIFEGEGFLSAYVKSRENLIHSLERKVEHLHYYYPAENLKHHLFRGKSIFNKYFLEKELSIRDPDSEGNIEIKSLILNWIKISENNALDETWLAEVLTLLQRFEVSKRLYEYYSPKEIRKSGNIKESLDVYILFGILLIKLITKISNIERKLILFNSLLKVGDIVVSSSDRLTTPCEFYLSKEMLLQELDIYKNLRGDLLNEI